MVVRITTLSLLETGKFCCTSAGHDGCPAMAVPGHGNSGLRTGLGKGPLVSGFGLRSQGLKADRACSFFDREMFAYSVKASLEVAFRFLCLGGAGQPAASILATTPTSHFPAPLMRRPAGTELLPALLSIPSAGSVMSSLACMSHLIPAWPRPVLRFVIALSHSVVPRPS